MLGKATNTLKNNYLNKKVFQFYEKLYMQACSILGIYVTYIKFQLS